MAGMMVLVMTSWLAIIWPQAEDSKLRGVMRVTCTKASRHAGSTALLLLAPNRDTSVPTLIQVTPCSAMKRAVDARVEALLLLLTTRRGTRRPPYWAMPIWMLSLGKGLKYLS